MRSRTTLLQHILGSNQDICGQRELHTSYTNKWHFLRVKAALQNESNYGTATYLLDKLLHNNLDIEESLFNCNLKCIFMLRPPEDTMVSMIKMHHSLFRNHNTEHLVQYYLERLNHLSRLSHNLGNYSIFLESDTLINDSNHTLQKLTTFLDLAAPLTSNYNISKHTGIPGFGDPSNNIKSGKIVRTTKKTSKLTNTDLVNLKQKYQLAKQTIKNNCKLFI